MWRRPRTGERLNLTPQTISGQLSLLEECLGLDLFARVGRNLEFTENGRLVLSYADQIRSAMINRTSWLVLGNKTDLGG